MGFGNNADEKGQRCWCYERCFFWSADVDAAAVLLLLCCCSCATLIMCLCFVFPSCAVSSWRWELCMHPPTKSPVLLLCGSTCIVAHFKKTQAATAVYYFDCYHILFYKSLSSSNFPEIYVARHKASYKKTRLHGRLMWTAL